MLPEKAKFCPQCGMGVEQEHICTNGHRMTVGQKFCCECGEPLAISEKITEPITDTHSKSPSVIPNKSFDTKILTNKMGRIFAKVIVTLIIIIIVGYIALEFGVTFSGIAAAFCAITIRNIWEFIDDM